MIQFKFRIRVSALLLALFSTAFLVSYAAANPAFQRDVSAVGSIDQYLLFENSDFENGDLANWTATGNAFDFQPTKGDNPTARKRRQPSKHQGEFWIGTFEKYQGMAGQRPGQNQGDRPTGTLKSVAFEVLGDNITFLVGGDKRLESEYVALVVDGQEVLKASGTQSESMTRHTWDVSAYKGKSAQILISDQLSTGWGHINADDFKYDSPVRKAAKAVHKDDGKFEAVVPGPLFENSDFENGDLVNWTSTGDAFDFQPTKGDNPKARNRQQPSKHQGQYWIGTFEKFQGEAGQRPGQVQGDRPTGTLTSIPFEIIGEKITFLIGGGKYISGCYAALLIDGREVLKTTGARDESMKPYAWDVSPYKGKTARIIIKDMKSGGWGHLNVDDFRFE